MKVCWVLSACRCSASDGVWFWAWDCVWIISQSRQSWEIRVGRNDQNALKSRWRTHGFKEKTSSEDLKEGALMAGSDAMSWECAGSARNFGHLEWTSNPIMLNHKIRLWFLSVSKFWQVGLKNFENSTLSHSTRLSTLSLNQLLVLENSASGHEKPRFYEVNDDFPDSEISQTEQCTSD